MLIPFCNDQISMIQQYVLLQELFKPKLYINKPNSWPQPFWSSWKRIITLILHFTYQVYFHTCFHLHPGCEYLDVQYYTRTITGCKLYNMVILAVTTLVIYPCDVRYQGQLYHFFHLASDACRNWVRGEICYQELAQKKVTQSNSGLRPIYLKKSHKECLFNLLFIYTRMPILHYQLLA